MTPAKATTPVELRLVVVTDRAQAKRGLLEVVKASLDGGAHTFLLREKDLPRSERLALAEEMRALGAFVIAAGTDPLGGDAIHLSAIDPTVTARLTGRSCHSQAEAMAANEDYVTLSPIFSSASKPGYGPALGVAALGIGTRQMVLALGGVQTPAQAAACREAGAAGVAVMGAIMRADDPAAIVSGFLR
ncbi:MAG TPA: thiamine phosphate synthase [Micromonosporaceae bacterium]|nr:thiamine phosphate synthase [Micromonosporaceae bacterium]HCU51731.1 thiamine phosphate synthase [Micromonosporaceae bacterium]